MYIINFIRGFFMAVADSVPGVSGGTIAFVLGFYDKFIKSLRNVVSKDKEKRKEAILFLGKIGIGWTVGIILSVLFIASVFEEHIYQISSLFIGLILAAIPIIIIEELDTLKQKYIDAIFTLLGIVIVFVITYFNPVVNGNSGIVSDIDNVTFGLAVFVILAGMIAISAMVLPGISGSTVLLIFGLYASIINAIKELLGFDFSYFLVVFLFGVGILLGIVITIPTVKKALEKARGKTMYLIIGLMIGSLYAVVMGPKTLEIPKDALSIQTFSIIFFILGIGLIIGLQYLKIYFEKQEQ